MLAAEEKAFLRIVEDRFGDGLLDWRLFNDNDRFLCDERRIQFARSGKLLSGSCGVAVVGELLGPFG
jgi:hypothetical protein